jgi:branched-chain amino acid aminotransferase
MSVTCGPILLITSKVSDSSANKCALLIKSLIKPKWCFNGLKVKGGAIRSGFITIFTTLISFAINKIIQPVVNISNKLHEKNELPGNPIQLYEVIRVIDGVPLFLENHLERLFMSAYLSGIENMPGYDDIEEQVYRLIEDKNKPIGNIKLNYTINDSSSQPKIVIDFIEHYYPSDDKYKTGVKVGLLKAERPNPQAKLQHLGIRNKANLIMSKENVYEVLLVDHAGNITEGSRSNVFFVKNDQLYTSPDEKILNGITRRKILKLCMDNHIPVIKNDLPVINIGQYEGAFLTGSSPKVLPISAIGDHHYNPDLPIARRIIELFNVEIDQYIKEKLQHQKNL